MGKKKLEKFEDNKNSKFIIEEGKSLYKKTKGKWFKIFKNNNPIVLEIGCGYGEYTTNLAKKNKDRNYIGIDIKGSRIWKGSKESKEENLLNVIFLRIRIEEIRDFFSKGEVDKIYIIFPDPRPKKRDAKKRLVDKNFMLNYSHILKNNGKIILKTDDVKLFDFCIKNIKNHLKHKNLRFTADYYKSKLFLKKTNIKSNYEKKYLSINKKIKYLEFYSNN